MARKGAGALMSFTIMPKALSMVYACLSFPSMAIRGSDGFLNLPLLICGGTLLESASSRPIGSPRVQVPVECRDTRPRFRDT